MDEVEISTEEMANELNVDKKILDDLICVIEENSNWKVRIIRPKPGARPGVIHQIDIITSFSRTGIPH